MTTARKKTDRPSPPKTHVLIVDDHPVVRHGFAQRINQEPDLAVCGAAATAHEALRQIDRLRPAVVLVDLRLDQGDGLDLIKDLRSRGDTVKILVISGHDESVYAERCIRAGAHGYLHKSQAVDKIVDAIRRVVADEYYVSRAVIARTFKRVASGGTDGSPIESLSDRELQVYELTGQGLTVNQIAEKLFLSPKTIETYRAHLKEKLGLRNSNELMRHAVQWVLQRA